MIKELKQTVNILPSISEMDMLKMFEHITATPYGNGLYDMTKTERIVETCVKRGHLSILEHGYIPLKCVTNIATYKDFTRHRHCAFTIESTSFCKYDDDLYAILTEPLTTSQATALMKVHAIYKSLTQTKVARDFLPQCCAAVMIMSTNVREWRHIIAVRGDPNDNPLTRELRDMIWLALNAHYPFFFPIGKNIQDNPMCIYDAWGKHKPCRLLSQQ
jgi:thymidylate synthase (FAD)